MIVERKGYKLERDCSDCGICCMRFKKIERLNGRELNPPVWDWVVISIHSTYLEAAIALVAHLEKHPDEFTEMERQP